MEYYIPTTVPHLLWLILILANFLVQMTWFNRPRPGLRTARRITTPLMLFGALAVIQLTSGAVPLIQGLLLAAMGLGEIGIEGSQVVESRDGAAPAKTPWTVTAAGTLFLAVNIFLGVVLLVSVRSAAAILIGIGSGLIVVGTVTMVLIRIHRPLPEIRFQILMYTGGLAVLAAGALSRLAILITGNPGGPSGPGHLGLAGLILTVSDSLVLWRMGASWDSRQVAGRRRLGVFLVVILLLYYLYIGVLIDSASPFRVS